MHLHHVTVRTTCSTCLLLSCLKHVCIVAIVQALVRTGSEDDLTDLLRNAALCEPVHPSKQGQKNVVKDAKKKLGRAPARPMKKHVAKATKAATATPTSPTKTPMKASKGVPNGSPKSVAKEKVGELLMERKNVRSRAYHKAFATAKKSGLDDEQSKVLARSAAREAVKDFVK